MVPLCTPRLEGQITATRMAQCQSMAGAVNHACLCITDSELQCADNVVLVTLRYGVSAQQLIDAEEFVPSVREIIELLHDGSGLRSSDEMTIDSMHKVKQLAATYCPGALLVQHMHS